MKGLSDTKVDKIMDAAAKARAAASCAYLKCIARTQAPNECPALTRAPRSSLPAPDTSSPAQTRRRWCARVSLGLTSRFLMRCAGVHLAARQRKAVVRISSGSASVDEVLGGGVESKVRIRAH